MNYSKIFMLKTLVLTIWLIFLFSYNLEAKLMEEKLSSEDETNNIKINLILRQHHVANPDYNIYKEGIKQNYNIDRLYQQNEEFYEFIGMFISKYESEQNFRIKLKMNKDVNFNKASINWKTNF